MNSPDTPSRRDNTIIAHVFRNSISTRSVIHKMFFPECHEDACRKVESRLIRKRLLTRYPLVNSSSYLRLGRAAINRWNYPRSRDRKLGSLRLPYELGTLAYMCLDIEPRKRLLSKELTGLLPWFPQSLMGWAYHLTALDSGFRLMTVRVETRVRADRALQKIGEQIHSYRETPEFGQLVDAGQFGVVIVTATSEQEEAVRNECEAVRFPVPITTAHYPLLVHFL